MNNLTEASAKGIETMKVAVAISLGIMIILLIPQKIFMKLRDVFVRKSQCINSQK